MEFDRWKRELLRNLRVFDFAGVVQRKTLYTLGHIRAGGDGTSTAGRFELDV